MKEIKFDDWRLTGFWIAMTLAALITGFVFGWCWRDRAGALASVSLLNCMTAIGTIGATFAAVYFGLEGSRRARHGKITEAQVAVWSMDVPIANLINVVDEITNGWKRNPNVKPTNQKLEQATKEIFAAISNVDRAALRAISAVDQACGKAFVEGLAELDLFCIAAERASFVSDNSVLIVNRLLTGARLLGLGQTLASRWQHWQ